MCVGCFPGTYMGENAHTNTDCKECATGQYQDLSKQASCKVCKDHSGGRRLKDRKVKVKPETEGGKNTKREEEMANANKITSEKSLPPPPILIDDDNKQNKVSKAEKFWAKGQGNE
eukprot:g8888.t1